MIKALNRNNKIHCEMSGTPDVLACELKATLLNFIQNQPEILHGVMLSVERELKESLEASDHKKTALIYNILEGATEDWI